VGALRKTATNPNKDSPCLDRNLNRVPSIHEAGMLSSVLVLSSSQKGIAWCNTFTFWSEENTCSLAVTATSPTDNTQSGVLSHTQTNTHTQRLWMLIQTTIPVTQTLPRTKQVATRNDKSRTLSFHEPTSKVAVKCVSLLIPVLQVKGSNLSREILCTNSGFSWFFWRYSYDFTLRHVVNTLPTFRHFIFLKPTGYVMHQQFNIQQLYALPTLYLCVLCLSENKQRLVPLTA